MQIRLIAFVLLGAWISPTILTAADPISTHARIDVVANSDTATLSKGRWYFEDQSFCQRMSWLTDKPHDATYFGEFTIVDFAAPPAVFSFVSNQDTEIKVELSGMWRDDERGGPKRLMVDWKGFEVSGAQVIGAPFQPRVAWVREPIQLKLQARKGVPIYLQVAAQSQREPQQTGAFEQTRAHLLATKLQRGINLSNWLEVPPNEDWGNNSCDASDFAEIKRNGFDHVRLPVGWHHQTGPRPGFTINQSIYRKVDQAVRLATQSGLAIILDIHHFEQFTDEPQKQRAKLVALWRQISRRYAEQDDNVFFEILNEPKDAANAAVMNEVYAEVIAAIRETNPNRGILVGPAEFNSVYQLEKLKLPDHDQALIVSFHNYAPFPFTHQGTDWSIPGLRWLRSIPFPGPSATKIDRPVNADESTKRWVDDFNTVRDAKFNLGGPLPIVRMLEMAKGWSDNHGRPVHLGEFGAYIKIDDASRANYYRAVRQECEKRGIGWAAWSWKADFAYFDERRKSARAGMKAALFD